MKSLSRLMLGLATIGLLIPQAQFAAAANLPMGMSGDQVASRVAIVDVALSQDHLLKGQLANGAGVPRANSAVTLSENGVMVGKATTDAQGIFVMNVKKGGIYTLSDGQTGAVVRVWTANAAPPSAKAGILMITGQDTARANLGGSHIGNLIGLAAIAGVTTAVVITSLDDGS